MSAVAAPHPQVEVVGSKGPQPWTDPCRGVDGRGCPDHETDDVASGGRYRGLGPNCRRRKTQADRLARGDFDDGIGSEDLKPKRQPKLSASVKALVPAAKRLERAVDGKKAADQATIDAARQFKEALDAVVSTAKSIVNTATVVPDED